MSLQIIGAGFGRTGTLSFKAALEQLGFGPCYHMHEVRKNEGHDRMWKAAAEAGDYAWPELLGDYRSAVDWPASYFWRQLAAAYPDAKVILTVRDPDRWYDSISKTILPSLSRPRKDPDDPRMASYIILERIFSGRLDDRAHAIDVFNANTRAVETEIPPERRLTYQASDGWQPLCRFLDVPVPDTPYPNVNSTAEFRQNVGLDTA